MRYMPNSAAGSSVKKLSRKNLLCLPHMSIRNLPTLSNIPITASTSDVLCLATNFLSDGERARAWLAVITIMDLSNEHSRKYADPEHLPLTFEIWKLFVPLSVRVIDSERRWQLVDKFYFETFDMPINECRIRRVFPIFVCKQITGDLRKLDLESTLAEHIRCISVRSHAANHIVGKRVGTILIRDQGPPATGQGL